MGYDIILLDADGTLYDFDASEENAMSETLRHAGLPATREIISVYHEINDREWKALERGETTREKLKIARFEKLFLALKHRGYISTVTAEEMADYYIHRLALQCIPLPEAEEVCRALAEKCSLYVVTNGTGWIQRSRFAPSPLTKYIKETYISEELGHDKPAGEFFDMVFADIGVTKEEAAKRAVIIGDSLSSDIRGGINAGIDTCWYNPKGKSSEDVTPTYTIRSLYDLYEICLSEKTN